jgi:hypothetical protein
VLLTERTGDTLVIYSEETHEGGGRRRKPKMKKSLYYPEWSGLSENEKELRYKQEVARISELTKSQLFSEVVLPRFLGHLERLEREGFFSAFGYDSECESEEYDKGLSKAKLSLKGSDGALGSLDKVWVKRNNRERFYRLTIKGVFLGYYPLSGDLKSQVNRLLRGGYTEWEGRAWRACRDFVGSL